MYNDPWFQSLIATLIVANFALTIAQVRSKMCRVQ
jgi:hypothetical protein